MIRGDSHYARPEAMAWLERNRVHYVFGLAGNRALLDRAAARAEDTAVRRAEEDADKIRCFHDFRYAAKSWKEKERRVIARIEATRQGSDTRFVVTNLTGTPRWLDEVLYCGRGPSAASWPRSLRESDRASADARWPRTSARRTSSTSPPTEPHAPRRRPTNFASSSTPPPTGCSTPKGLAAKTSFWRDAQLDTIRLAFAKVAARVTELVTRIKVSLPSSYPY